LLSRYFSLQGFSTLYGLAWTAFAAGTAVGPILMGRLYSSTGGYQSWGIQLLALPTLLSGVLMALMPAYPKAVNLGFIDLLPAEGMGPRAVVSDL
jgi:MFS family permease